MTDKISIANASLAYPLPTPAKDASAVNSNTRGAYALTRANPTSSEKLLKPGFIQRAKSFMSRIGIQPVFVADASADQRALAAEMRSSIYQDMHREIEIAWGKAKSVAIDACQEKNVEIIRNAISHQIDNMAAKYKTVYDRAYIRARSSPENFVLASLLSAHKPALRAARRYQQNMWVPQEACGKAVSIFGDEMYMALGKFVECHIVPEMDPPIRPVVLTRPVDDGRIVGGWRKEGRTWKRLIADQRVVEMTVNRDTERRRNNRGGRDTPVVFYDKNKDDHYFSDKF